MEWFSLLKEEGIYHVLYKSFFDFIFLSFLTFSVNVLEINRLCINLGWQKWQESLYWEKLLFWHF